MSNIRLKEPSLIERIVQKVLSRLTFSMTGLRVDAGGSSVVASIAATQTLATVTTVGTVNGVNNTAIGRSTVDAAGIMTTSMTYNMGFRRNLTVS